MSLKNKNLLSIALILMLIATVGLAYAYWDDLSKDSGSTLEIGVGTTLRIEDVVSSDGDIRLIPIGAVLGTNEVEQIVKDYDVVLSKVLQEPLYLNAEVSNIQIGNKKYDGLVNIEITKPETIYDRGKVSLIISMNNLDIDYSEIYNKDITYSLELSVLNDSN